MALADKLAAARAARPYRDVVVTLDGEVSQERERLLETLETADREARLGVKSEAEEIQEKLDALAVSDANTLTLRFTRLPGRDWSVLTSHHPVRPDVPIDRVYGYNYDATCEAAASFRDSKTGEAFGHVIEDGKPADVTPEEWTDLFAVLAGSDVESIRDAIWILNQYEPEQRLQSLVKGSGAAARSVSK